MLMDDAIDISHWDDNRFFKKNSFDVSILVSLLMATPHFECFWYKSDETHSFPCSYPILIGEDCSCNLD